MTDLKQRLISDPRYAKGLQETRETPRVLIAPTNYCNFACSYCSTASIKNRPVNMDLALVRSLVDQCVANGWPVSFGQTYEPFLHPDIEAIVRHVVDSGLEFHSATNGCKIKRPLWDLPMSLLLSFSADEHDYAYRESKLPYATYRAKLIDFSRHRIKHLVPGTISFQIADYNILENELEYSKEMKQTDLVYDKTLALAHDLGLAPENEPGHDKAEWLDRISRQESLQLFAEGSTGMAVTPTKIQPNSYDAFVTFEEPQELRGYCDSCHTMMSIQADGQVAFCCCDPSATAIAGTIDATTDLNEFWTGPEMEKVREGFRAFQPIHPFCTNCLVNVSEHIKPLLTVQRPAIVGEILSDMGVTEDQPWFRFPK